MPVLENSDTAFQKKMTGCSDWAGTLLASESGETQDRPATQGCQFIRATPKDGRKKGRLALQKVLINQGTSVQPFPGAWLRVSAWSVLPLSCTPGHAALACEVFWTGHAPCCF